MLYKPRLSPPPLRSEIINYDFSMFDEQYLVHLSEVVTDLLSFIVYTAWPSAVSMDAAIYLVNLISIYVSYKN
jgi:hypothetical protein